MNSIGAWLGRWVEVCEHRPRQVLAVIGVLTALAAVYVATSFSIDSNLDKLLRPSGQLSWFEANETLKALFPEQQQTSVVVVSGPDLDAVDRTASRLQAHFRRSMKDRSMPDCLHYFQTLLRISLIPER